MTAAPKSADAYCLVLDRRQLCLLFALTYGGDGSASSVTNELAALILGRPGAAAAGLRAATGIGAGLRSAARDAVLAEFPTLQGVFNATAAAIRADSERQLASARFCDEYATAAARDAS